MDKQNEIKEEIIKGIRARCAEIQNTQSENFLNLEKKIDAVYKDFIKLKLIVEDSILLTHQNTLIENPILSNKESVESEVQKRDKIIRLDLNDKIAFQNQLFNQSSEELTKSITLLNETETLDEAKSILNQWYEIRQWNQKEEFYQRLLSAVERRFN